jgi:hypothetical protein
MPRPLRRGILRAADRNDQAARLCAATGVASPRQLYHGLPKQRI